MSFSVKDKCPIVIDLDDTLIKYADNEGWENIMEKYKTATPNKTEISYLNSLYETGYKVIIHTGRGWDKYELTKDQLKKFGIKHHELVMGKPQGIYIDKDSYKSLLEIVGDL
jgi:hydroxymethylpyrimidine pyrophosphatase-like HAD family hydrolase